ncbi:hypothetical protein CHLRE_07g325710v5 [Chlamydomonas reinhardtii]|uniref:Uncharacterized protein n=1 Tax=Chlamydomonas reinhardtii TaxID=3055 RepID=A0A2K3DJD2_CHLRE|nr:uncharacterized protein CHLRE_07g325710v5 [Chlamydomonas reinhardtii]PNW80631.1 hypothetical protein CHLRE_07g325710v5 [Chlamydomonas reinhardtii]
MRDYERAAQGLPPRAVVRREDLPAAAAATLGAIRDTLARLWQESGSFRAGQPYNYLLTLAQLPTAKLPPVRLRGVGMPYTS